jgi:hypothetical protein
MKPRVSGDKLNQTNDLEQSDTRFAHGFAQAGLNQTFDTSAGAHLNDPDLSRLL